MFVCVSGFRSAFSVFVPVFRPQARRRCCPLSSCSFSAFVTCCVFLFQLCSYTCSLPFPFSVSEFMFVSISVFRIRFRTPLRALFGLFVRCLFFFRCEKKGVANQAEKVVNS